MDANVIISAFIGSFLGVTSGFLGAFFLDWQRTRRERRTHILALVREILSNNVRVQLLLNENRREGGLQDQAWRALRVELAGDLPMDLYSRLASHYDEFADVNHIYRELERAEEHTNNDEEARRLDVWMDRMMEDSERLRAEIERGGESLLRALRRRERREAERHEQGAGQRPAGSARR